MGKSCKAMEKRLVKQQSPIFGKNKNFFRRFCIIGQIFLHFLTFSAIFLNIITICRLIALMTIYTIA